MLTLLFYTLTGLSLLIASGCVFNNTIDRNMDKKMTRTQNRALPKGLISPEAAVLYGTLLGIGGMALLFMTTSLLCALIAMSGFTVYVVLYSLVLKPRSVHSTLVGSLAGAAPPLAGYCAVSNRFDMGALILLFLFGLWQMPHCYAIAVLRHKDYAAANIPTLPVKRGIPTAKRHSFVYLLAFMAAAVMPTFGGYTGYAYLTAATVMCLSWLFMAWLGSKAGNDRAWAGKLFVSSIATITVLSIMMSIDFTPREILLASQCVPVP